MTMGLVGGDRNQSPLHRSSELTPRYHRDRIGDVDLKPGVFCGPAKIDDMCAKRERLQHQPVSI